MIKIVNYTVKLDDNGNITSITLKLKHIIKGNEQQEYPLLTTISIAFFETTLLNDVGKSFNLAINPRRNNIANMTINLKKSKLSHEDISNFITYFQKVLDGTVS